MKKNIGFTLIELLAVIVILAVVVLISVSLIGNVIEESKKSAFIDSGKNLLRAAELRYMEGVINNKEEFVLFNIKDGVIEATPESAKLSYSGKLPDNGSIYISKTGKVTLSLHDGKYCMTKDEISESEVSEKNSGECTLPLPAPVIDFSTNGAENDIVSTNILVTSDVLPIKTVEYKWTNSIDVPTNGWTSFTPGDTVSQSTLGSYYLHVKVVDLSGRVIYKVSNLFKVIVLFPEPVVSAGMIPVIWNGSNWIKADKTNQSVPYKWYNYTQTDKKWANAVLINSANRTTYQNAALGTTINLSHVMGHLVWIPRYKYQVFNATSSVVAPQTINITFEKNNIAKSNGSTNGSWLTHPAFTYNGVELNGFWAGKFETTGTSLAPSIKPNLSSLRDMNISAMHTTVDLFNNATNYGLSAANEAHIMKNMEWGAITYLTQSIYGKNSEVTINSGNYSGGGSASEYVTLGAQSTTGNIYGIYDMSGGASEYVMSAQFNSDNTTINRSSSGISSAVIDTPTFSKYINKYTYGTSYSDINAYNRRMLGDATGEVRGWNSDLSNFVYTSYPWFARGGYSGSNAGAGLNAFDQQNGSSNSNISFRTVILGN